MKTISMEMVFPQDMAPYISCDIQGLNQDIVFARNAMILYPFIHNTTISYGRAAEILGIHKTDLIEFYDSMGIPYLNQSEEELLSDLATMDRVMGVR